jgi:ADP-ribose pyrophosphatase
MSRPWPQASESLLLHTRVFDVRAMRRQSPRDATLHDFYVIDAPDWVNVVAVTDDGQLVLVEQWRHGTGAVTLEIPGGMVDPGETAQEAAIRELREETGYEAASIELLGVVEPNPAIQSNRCSTYFASGCRKVVDTHFDATEECVLRLEPVARAAELVTSGEINHSLVVAGLGYAWLKGKLPR